MKTKIFPLLTVFIFFIVFFLFYKGLHNSKIYVPSLDVKKEIPDLQYKIFESEKMINSNEIFKNDKFYLFNIWASWCIPCKEEHPFLMNLSNEKEIEIIGLNYKDDVKNAKNFLNDLKNPYNTIVSDEDGTIAIEWGAFGVPETFLIYDKKIIKKIIGPLNSSLYSEIKEKIK